MPYTRGPLAETQTAWRSFSRGRATQPPDLSPLTPSCTTKAPFAPQTTNSHLPQLSRADSRHRTLPSLSVCEEAALLSSPLPPPLPHTLTIHLPTLLIGGSQKGTFFLARLFFLSAFSCLTTYFNAFSTLLSCVSICRHEP